MISWTWRQVPLGVNNVQPETRDRNGAEPVRLQSHRPSRQDRHQMQKTPPDLHELRWRGFGCKSGAEGIRTPDPLTASQVRYQLRHSPLRGPKLHDGPATP